MPLRPLAVSITSALMTISMGSLLAAPSAEQLAFFETKVRPVFAEKCYSCHSNQAKKLKADLFLDHGTSILQGGDSGPAVVPGNLDQSLIIEAVRYKNPDMQMPPKKRLSDSEIHVLEEWVTMGAPWPDEPAPEKRLGPKEFDMEKRKNAHWCWQPVEDSAVPDVIDSAWPAGPIDRFVLAKLEEKGLRPAPGADKRALIRRVSFDLTGLPPSVAEVDAFLADDSPGAFANVVDRLLASPHFGERWARHWMDLVRYAESCGHEFDYPIRHAHEYRDYLTRAFNADVPYDQFVREHIAGDLLVEPRRHPEEKFNESVIATGFWFLHEATHAPTDVRGDEAGRVDNQIDVMSKAFLGVTVACARCHDHMFDAISTKDYYALAGYLQSSRRQEAMLDPGRKIEAAVAELEAISAKETALNALPKTADPKAIGNLLLAAREVVLAGDRSDLKAIANESGVDPVLLQGWVRGLKDDSLKSPAHPMYVWRAGMKEGEGFRASLDGVRKRLVNAEEHQAAMPERGTLVASAGDWMATGHAFDQLDCGKLRGVLRSPTFELTGDHVQLRMKAMKGRISARLIIDGYVMEVNNGLLFNGTRLNDIDTGGGWKWLKFAGDTKMYRGRRAHVEVIDHGDGSAEVGELWVTEGGAEPAPPVSELAKAVAGKDFASLEELAVGYGWLFKRALEGNGPAPQLIAWLREFGLPKPGLKQKLEVLAKQRAEIEKRIPAPRLVQAMVDGSPEDESIFLRGNHKRLGDKAPRQFLSALGGEAIPPSESGSGREILAQQMAAETNPLTPRVMVNRLWHHLLGVGIVPTTDDFGVLGLRPTHPELLDHLAASFVADGWSVKRQIRRIILSHTYQMSSRAGGGAEELDPTNSLLHRARVKRLQGEAIRDSILSISGRLDRKLFGSPVAVHVTPFMTGRGRPKGGPLDGGGRRSIYTSVKRNFLSPMMLAFDTPIPFSVMGRRASSNVPAQALILMNDPFVVGQAEVWAERILSLKLDPRSRIEQMYQEAFARSPSAAEVEAGLEFVGSRDEIATWKDFAHVLINTKEFIFVE